MTLVLSANFCLKFNGLSKIQILVLDNNDLTSLPDDVFKPLRDLEYLYIRENE